MPTAPVYDAPKLPTFSPQNIINGLITKIHDNEIQMWVIIGIAVVVMMVAIYMIYVEYKKKPLRWRSMKLGKMGKGFKLSDILRKQ